jgi:hypothetical protein
MKKRIDTIAFQLLPFNIYTLLQVFLHLFGTFMEVTVLDLLQRGLRSHLNIHCVTAVIALQLVLHTWKEVKIVWCETWEVLWVGKQHSNLLGELKIMF